MASVNKVIIVGSLGRDPETRFNPSGDSVTRISVATSWKNKDSEQTEWHRVVMFGKLAEIASKYLRKGTQVYIEGRLQTSKYTGKDGIERYSTDIIASQMQMLGMKGETSGRPAPQKQDAPFTNESLEDILF